MEIKKASLMILGTISMLFFLNGCLILPIPYKGYPHKRITGRLIDANTRLPIKDAKISYQYAVPASLMAGQTIVSMKKTDENGSFVIDPVRMWYPCIFMIFFSWGPPEYNILSARKNNFTDLVLNVKHDAAWFGAYYIFKFEDNLGDLKMTPEKIE